MKSLLSYKKLKKSFYTRNVLKVAEELLGKILVHNIRGQILAGKIVEVEAYDGKIDKAAHSYVGKTKRNEVMFREGGYLYVYLSYGVHYCCNVVTGKKEHGTAVLIRAIEPIEGMEQMIKNRFGKKDVKPAELKNLTNGPGKVCKAMNINISHSGIDLLGDEIYLLNNRKVSKEKIGKSKRIGISKSVNLPWRFYIKNNPFLSR